MGFETLIVLALAIIFGLYMAWNIGANDVANAMGTSVGSKSLTLKQAVILASVLEFCGAYFVGGHVTDTVRKGMIDLSQIDNPEVLMYGMLGSMLAAGLWLQFATFMRVPVSTTQSIVGAIVGFGLVVAGTSAINWSKVYSIVASWFISPIMSAAIAVLLFWLIQHFVFKAENPLIAMRSFAPFLTFSVIVVLALVTTFKGLKNLHLDLDFAQAAMLSVGIAIFPAIATWFMVDRLIKNADKMKDSETAKKDEYHFHMTEKVFKYLQVLSAASVAFAHGANDVANAIGPMAAVWEIANTGVIADTVAVNPIFPLIGGIGIVFGLATWGWKIIETIGERITDLTPSRGFVTQFGAAITILSASRLGLPVSTTHCLVGAVVGIGIARGMASIDLKVVVKIFVSWIIEIPVAALLSIGIFYILTAIFM
jgi:PiT family inorganic phosphate transporter